MIQSIGVFLARGNAMNAQIDSAVRLRHNPIDSIPFRRNYADALACIGWVMLLCLAPCEFASAASAPPLGTTGTYGVVSSTYTNSNTSPQTIINGDVCFATGPTTPPLSIIGATQTPCPPQTGLDQGAAAANANGQLCTFLGAGAITLDSVVIAGNPPGTIPPGCYSSGGAMLITATTNVTLKGPGVYIFRPGGALTTGANSNVLLSNGACASDVFWVPVGATTLGANAALSPTPTFSGNILDAAGNHDRPLCEPDWKGPGFWRNRDDRCSDDQCPYLRNGHGGRWQSQPGAHSLCVDDKPAGHVARDRGFCRGARPVKVVFAAASIR